MPIADLETREGWRVQDLAARVHYRGDGDRYSVEYYAESDRVIYWVVDPDRDAAVPVGREDVPAPLRERIREDLAAAGIAPEIEREPV